LVKVESGEEISAEEITNLIILQSENVIKPSFDQDFQL